MKVKWEVFIMVKVQLGVRIDAALKKAMDKVAKEERRPLAAQVEVALEQWLAHRKTKVTKS